MSPLCFSLSLTETVSDVLMLHHLCVKTAERLRPIRKYLSVRIREQGLCVSVIRLYIRGLS